MVSTFPAAGDSDAWPLPRPTSQSRRRKGPQAALWVRLGGRLQLTNPQREGWEEKGISHKSEKLEPWRGKSRKAARKAGEARRWKRGAGCARPRDGPSPPTHPVTPAPESGMRRPEGRTPEPDTRHGTLT